jgi:hypothetical protein
VADPYQDWYRKWAEKTGINPDPDDPRHFYDYRAAYDAGDEPTLGEDGYHWPSKHKREGHPNMVVDGVDTKTGAPSFGGGSSSGAGAGSDWGLTDVDIEEMIRNKPTLEDTIRDGPSARPLTLPTMLSPEQTHEAKKDYLKMVGEEAVAGAALGGVGRVGKAALPFLPTKLPQFKKWFSGSKVVDDAGEPLVMYHGTSVPDVDVFETYGSNYGLMGTGSYFTASPKVASGYAETGRKKASRMGSEPSPNVMPVYLNLRNPIDMDAPADKSAWIAALKDTVNSNERFTSSHGYSYLGDGATNEDALREMESLLVDSELPNWEGAEEIRVLLESMGHDGLTHIGGGRTGGLKHRVYVAFNPEAVKSATGNRGTFDPTDPRITYGVAGAGLATQEDIESNLDVFKKALGGQ